MAFEQNKTIENANKLQSIISDNLFAQPEHISDVKQVLELMKSVGQNVSQDQIRAIILLENLGNNKLIHPDGNPYSKLIKAIIADYKVAVVNPAYYLDTIDELVPKPPKPVVFAPNGKQVSTGRE